MGLPDQTTPHHTWTVSFHLRPEDLSLDRLHIQKAFLFAEAYSAVPAWTTRRAIWKDLRFTGWVPGILAGICYVLGRRWHEEPRACVSQAQELVLVLRRNKKGMRSKERCSLQSFCTRGVLQLFLQVALSCTTPCVVPNRESMATLFSRYRASFVKVDIPIEGQNP